MPGPMEVWYSDYHLVNGPVFRPPFEYQSLSLTEFLFIELYEEFISFNFATPCAFIISTHPKSQHSFFCVETSRDKSEKYVSKFYIFTFHPELIDLSFVVIYNSKSTLYVHIALILQPLGYGLRTLNTLSQDREYPDYRIIIHVVGYNFNHIPTLDPDLYLQHSTLSLPNVINVQF